MSRVFLLSPANASGVRARMVMNQDAQFDLAVRLRNQGAPIGELFAFISGLYFRGKIAYAARFGTPLVITAGRGLVHPATPVTLEELNAIAAVPVDLAHPSYREPLEREALRLRESLSSECEVVLLGSIATPKYLEPLMDILGSRLVFPSAFIGLGDMSRGGLMLRCAREGTELDYIPAYYETKKRPKPR